MIKEVYGKEALGRSAVFRWHKHFAQGRESLEDDENTHQETTVKTELKILQVATLVCTNHSKMIDEIAAAAAGICHGTCHRILMLNMSRLTQHSVPYSLMQGQCDNRMSI
jgi:hypothetical protein